MSGTVEEEYVPEEKGTILYGISQHFAEEIQPHFDQVLKQMDLASSGSSSDVKLAIQPSQKKRWRPLDHNRHYFCQK